MINFIYFCTYAFQNFSTIENKSWYKFVKKCMKNNSFCKCHVTHDQVLQNYDKKKFLEI